MDEPDYPLTEKTLKITKEIIKKKCQGPRPLSDNGTNVPSRSSDYKIKHQSKFCINLPDHQINMFRENMKLLDNFLRNNPEKWTYVVEFFTSGKCKEKIGRKDSAEEPEKTCFDKMKMGRAKFRFLEAKLTKNPKCIVILIDKLMEHSLLESY